MERNETLTLTNKKQFILKAMQRQVKRVPFLSILSQNSEQSNDYDDDNSIAYKLLTLHINVYKKLYTIHCMLTLCVYSFCELKRTPETMKLIDLEILYSAESHSRSLLNCILNTVKHFY